ncbi:MAG: beta-lactamase family protein [Firmicutes bacterium]|nr:beta-lactamase family protein [Bacillota bacterium]
MNTALLDGILQRMVDDGALPMASAIVLRHGEEIYRGYTGLADLEQKKPVQDDTIYRLYSMTKVITATAMMQLFEQGKFKMTDPVQEYLPGFINQKFITYNEKTGHVVYKPVTRPNTIRNLFTMTSGIPYDHPGRTLSADMMHEIYEIIDHSPETDHPVTTIEAANMIGTNPLEFNPGDGYQYGLSMDVIGALVEILSGQDLRDYVKEHILDPLGMKDTDYYVPVEKQDRFAHLYTRVEKGKWISGETFKDARQLKLPVYKEGGDGIVSTTRDYAVFGQMLLQRGTYGKERILGSRTVDFMRANHLTPAQNAMMEDNMALLQGYGYGLGVRTCINPGRAKHLTSVGEWGWFGKGSSWFCVDPKEDMVIVFNTQSLGDDSERDRFINAVYAQLEDN